MLSLHNARTATICMPLGMPIGTIMHTEITATSWADFGGDEE